MAGTAAVVAAAAAVVANCREKKSEFKVHARRGVLSHPPLFCETAPSLFASVSLKEHKNLVTNAGLY